MVEVAKINHPEARFACKNILEEKLTETFDFVLMQGLFNNPVKNSKLYMESILEEAYAYCKTGMGFNFISEYVNYKTLDMEYFKPEEVIGFCIKHLSRKLSVFHHYYNCDVCIFVYR